MVRSLWPAAGGVPWVFEGFAETPVDSTRCQLTQHVRIHFQFHAPRSRIPTGAGPLPIFRSSCQAATHWVCDGRRAPQARTDSIRVTVPRACSQSLAALGYIRSPLRGYKPIIPCPQGLLAKPRRHGDSAGINPEARPSAAPRLQTNNPRRSLSPPAPRATGGLPASVGNITSGG
jgi:hypothetical protein